MKNRSSNNVNKPKVAVFSLHPKNHACSLIRVTTPLIKNNWEVTWCAKNVNSKWQFDFESASKSDLIIIQRHFPAPYTESLLRKILSLRLPIIYDLDDMFLNIPKYHPSRNNLKKHIPYIKWILRSSDIITVSTPELQKSLKKYTNRPIYLQANLVDWDLFYSPPRQKNNNFNFLISGTSTHKEDWSIIERPLQKILDMYPEKVNAIFFGDIPKNLSNHPSVQLIKFQDSYNKYANCLRNLNVNCALVPLKDTLFNNCKSNIKWLEYSAAGILGIYSNIAPYQSSITHEETGLLVDNTYDAWFQAMRKLIENPEIILPMAKNAQLQVSNNFSVENSSCDYNKFMHNLISKSHNRRLISELSILPTLLKKESTDLLLSFLNKHILWRFNQKN